MENIVKGKFGNTGYYKTAEDVLREIEDLIEEDDFIAQIDGQRKCGVSFDVDLDEMKTLVSYVRSLEKKLGIKGAS